MVVAVLVAVAFIGIVVVPQPSVALTNLQPGTAGCYPSGGLYWTYGFQFTLVNNGLSDGSVTVTGFLDGAAIGSEQYLVPRDTSVHGGMTFSASDCNAHTATVAITLVDKAWL